MSGRGGNYLTPNLNTTEEFATKDELHPTRPFRRPVYLVCAILLAVLLIFSAVAGSRIFRSASLMYGMTYATPPLVLRVYSRALRHTPVTTDLWIQGRRGPLEIRVMAPKDLPNAPVIVLVHGFASDGIHDALLNALAQRLCRSGLKVVMPDIESEKMLRIDKAAVDDVDDAIRWSAKTSGEKVSVFGISFSGGMVISAAAQAGYAQYVKLIFCVSGYNSIDRLGRYYLRDDVREPDGHRYPSKAPPENLAPIALQYLEELVPSEDARPLSNAVRTMAGQTGSSKASLRGVLTSEQRVLLDDLLRARTPEMRARYHAVLERHRAELAYISPMGKIHDLRSALFLLHGYADETIPIGEAEWTAFEGVHLPNVKINLTSWVNHSILVPGASFPDKLRVVYFVSEMLDEALQPAPLPDPAADDSATVCPRGAIC
jgi:pimeloyl-ACP methyl ester carboxylesterase